MFRTPLRRLLALIPIVGLVISMVFIERASAESAGEASLSEVSCSNEQGVVVVTLTAYSTGTDDVPFNLRVDNAGDDVVIPVKPGEPKPVPINNLNDGTHHIEVVVNDQTVLDQNFNVACDTPQPYTNPWGSITDICDGKVLVAASNMPSREQLQGLQPVKFTVTFVSNVSGGVQQLDAFTLPSGEDDAFDTQRTYNLGSPGIVSLYADGVALQHLDYSHACVIPVGHHKPRHHGTTVLPNTGK